MEIKYVNGKYKVIGEFDFGFAWKFSNDENGKHKIKNRWWIVWNFKSEVKRFKKSYKKLTKLF